MTLQAVITALVNAGDGQSIAVAGYDTYTIHGYDPPPPKWDTYEIPGLYVLTGASTDVPQGDDGADVLENRAFHIQVPFMPVGASTPYSREVIGRPILDAMKLVYRDFARNGLVTGVFQMRVVNDSGIAILTEYDGQFIGFDIEMLVQMMIDPR